MNKPKTISLMILIIAFAFSASAQSLQNIKRGTLTNDPPDEFISPKASTQSYCGSSANRVNTLINFDDIVDAPCLFMDAMPAAQEYDYSYGLLFEGPTSDEGGAFLNECSNFDVTGYSPPNFLAFNIDSGYSSGYPPTGPELIAFNSPVSYVELLAASSDETVTLFAYDANSQFITSEQIIATNDMQLLSVAGEGIKYLLITFTGSWLVIDDLLFDTYLPAQKFKASLEDDTGEVMSE